MSPAELSRRAFLARMGAIAFAVPLVTSFTLDAVAGGSADQALPNQAEFFANQGAAPNGYFPNQNFPNEYSPQDLENQAQAYPNQLQRLPNQAFYPNQFQVLPNQVLQYPNQYS